MSSCPKTAFAWRPVEKAQSIAVYLLQLVFLFLILCGAGVSWLLHGGELHTGGDEDEATARCHSQEDRAAADTAVESSTPTKAAVACADDVCTPQLRLLGVSEPTSGATRADTAAPRSGAMPGQATEEGRTQERPVRPAPTAIIDANSRSAGAKLALESPPSTQTLSLDALCPTPATPPPPHPPANTTAARTVDPADDLPPAASAGTEEGAVQGNITAGPEAAAAAACGPHVARNLEAALLTAAAAADTADTDSGIRGAEAADTAGAVELWEAGPHKLPDEGRGRMIVSEGNVATQHVDPAANSHPTSCPTEAGLQHLSPALDPERQEPVAARAPAGTGIREAVPRQHSGAKRGAGGTAGGEAAPAVHTVVSRAQQQQQKQQKQKQPAVTTLKRVSSDGRHHTTIITAASAVTTHFTAASRPNEGASPPAHAAAAHAAQLSGGAMAAAAAAATAPACTLPDGAQVAAPHQPLPHYLLPTAASMSRRSSQGLGSSPTTSGSHGLGSPSGAAAGALPVPVRGRSIHLPAAPALAQQHHEVGAGALVSPRSPTSPGSRVAAGAMGRATSLRRVSQPSGAASGAASQAPVLSTSRKEPAVA